MFLDVLLIRPLFSEPDFHKFRSCNLSVNFQKSLGVLLRCRRDAKGFVEKSGLFWGFRKETKELLARGGAKSGR